MNGFVGGGQVGCNWQYVNAVWGLETDFQGSAQKGSRFAAFNISEGTSSHNIEAKASVVWDRACASWRTSCSDRFALRDRWTCLRQCTGDRYSFL